MKVIVNGKEKELKAGAVLGDAIEGEFHVEGAVISVHLSTERLVRETSDFELVLSSGTMVLHLDDSEDARRFKSLIEGIKGSTTRWTTRDIVSVGAFPTDIAVDKTERRYRPFECFFALGGFDNHTTYVMIAKRDHIHAYGAGTGRIGRITVGKHMLDRLREGEELVDIRPLMSETSSENVIITRDLDHPLEDGYRIETCANIVLDRDSHASSEQVLIVSSKGYMNVSESTGSFMGCRDDMDADIPDEKHEVRTAGSVTVRSSGVGEGHIMIYKETRQVSQAHNHAGRVDRGTALVARAAVGDKVAIVTDPPRVLAVGMTQAEGGRLLSESGVRQVRTGDTSDKAVIVEQSPEMTMDALEKGEAETFGVPPKRVFRVRIDDGDPLTAYYFRKVVGLDHKPVGALKVQFTYPGMPMITFHGDDVRAKNLHPQDPFEKCLKGDIGVTNQSRPHHGLIGIRLEDSKEYGPTGEEPYGTNIAGRFLDDLKRLKGLEDEDTIYIIEDKEESG